MGFAPILQMALPAVVSITSSRLAKLPKIPSVSLRTNPATDRIIITIITLLAPLPWAAHGTDRFQIPTSARANRT
jgi:hypothetical protein